MKKIGLVLLCGFVLFGVCGCGNKEEEKLSEIENQIFNAIVDYGKRNGNYNNTRLIKTFVYEDQKYIHLTFDKNDKYNYDCLRLGKSTLIETPTETACLSEKYQDTPIQDVSIGKINRKLQNYWKEYEEDLGL